MRLDHLLSKEHLTRPASVGSCRGHAPAERVGGGAQGWNINYGGPLGPASRQYSFGMERAPPGRVGRPGTLLGPEGTAREGGCFMTGPVGRSNRQLLFGAGGRRRREVGDRSLFENCTVDASIF